MDASSLRVRCVQRSDSTDPHARILAVGGLDPRGTPFRYSHADAVAGIREGRFSMYFDAGGHDTPVVVARGNFSHYYLKGEGDVEQPDSLLALPDCED